jgi:hypothetical protein
MAKQEVKLLKKEDEKFCIKGEVKIDNRGREEVFEVQHNGVSLEWTANVSEALSAHKATPGSKLYAINMGTGNKTLRG